MSQEAQAEAFNETWRDTLEVQLVKKFLDQARGLQHMPAWDVDPFLYSFGVVPTGMRTEGTDCTENSGGNIWVVAAPSLLPV